MVASTPAYQPPHQHPPSSVIAIIQRTGRLWHWCVGWLDVCIAVMGRCDARSSRGKSSVDGGWVASVGLHFLWLCVYGQPTVAPFFYSPLLPFLFRLHFNGSLQSASPRLRGGRQVFKGMRGCRCNTLCMGCGKRELVLPSIRRLSLLPLLYWTLMLLFNPRHLLLSYFSNPVIPPHPVMNCWAVR